MERDPGHTVHPTPVLPLLKNISRPTHNTRRQCDECNIGETRIATLV